MKNLFPALFSASLVLFLPLLGVAQQAPDSTAREEIYRYVEQMPQYEGGLQTMMQFIGSQVSYSKTQPEGKVVVSFVVDKDGTIDDVTVIKSLDPALDEACVRAVYAMEGKWTPGVQRGKPVPVRYLLPINFSQPKKKK